MSIFTALRDRIFGHRPPQPGAAAAASTASPAAAPAAPQGANGGASPASPTSSPLAARPEAAAQPAASQSSATQTGAATETPQPVDIEKILESMGAKRSEKLDWRRSIVDLLKLVGVDSSFAARKQLADELGYAGDKNDSAAMNMWLHKQVMKKLAENGGKVPAELLS